VTRPSVRNQFVGESGNTETTTNISFNNIDNNESLNELLETIVGPPIQNKRKYRCKKCGVVGHNAAKCSCIKDNEKTKNINSGDYIIDIDPASDCGIGREIYLGFNKSYLSLIDNFQQATNRILAYTLCVGYEEFFTTYYDIV
jgi:hypothetical protein